MDLKGTGSEPGKRPEKKNRLPRKNGGENST